MSRRVTFHADQVAINESAGAKSLLLFVYAWASSGAVAPAKGFWQIRRGSAGVDVMNMGCRCDLSAAIRRVRVSEAWYRNVSR